MTSASICDEQLAKKLSKEYHTLNIVISTGRAKELLGCNMTVKELEELTSDKIDVYYRIYELNYANKVSSCLYSYAINKVLPIDDIEKLQEDLNSS
jgi:hypothetical protein